MTNSQLFIALVVLTAAIVGWTLTQMIFALVAGERRKLEARLATGLSGDVSATYRPLSVQKSIEGLPPLLAGWGLLDRLHRRLVQVQPDASLTRFLSLVALITLGTFGITLIATNMVLLSVGAAFIAGSIPFLWVNTKHARRRRQMEDQLPDVLEFLSRILRAGHSLPTGLQMVADEMPQPIASEFRRCYDQHSLGKSLDDALKEMADRVESSDFAFMVSAILIQRQTGGDLAQVLDNISGMVRARIRLQQHVKAVTAQGRMTGYALFAFPFAMFGITYVMNREYANVLLETEIGQMLIGGALVLQWIGLLMIRKIVSVKL